MRPSARKSKRYLHRPPATKYKITELPAIIKNVPKSGSAKIKPPTNPTARKNGKNPNLKVRIPFSPTLPNHQAKKITMASLASSEGWKEKNPRSSHLWAPPNVSPSCGRKKKNQQTTTPPKKNPGR